MPTTPPCLTCLIIDDNEMNRLTLEHFVELTDNLTLVASLADSVEALSFLKSHPPVDVLLLDIEMPHLSGLDLVKILPHPQPEVILVTSHRDFAVEAFALRVADYLVKPVEYARFLQAMTLAAGRRASSKTASLESASAEVQVPAQGSVLFVKVNNKLVRLNFDDVLFIEAMSTYSVIVTPTHKHIVYASLKALEQRLPFAHFRRVHRSYVVNTHRISFIEDNMLVLGSYEVPVGKSYQEEFFRSLPNL